MADDARILELVEAVLDSRLAPEEVCAHSPELLADVKACLNECRNVDLMLEHYFPPSPPVGGTATPRPAEGDRFPSVDGYEMLDIVDRGGSGIIYRARHLRLKRVVALKMLLSGEYAGRAELARFTCEAQAVAALQHPNIVQIFDVGEVDGRAYFAMEFVGGGSLARKQAGVPQPARYAASTVETLARAVHVAHLSGIVHRDLKPSNILLTPDGTPKVTDFGLARRDDNGIRGMTLTGFPVGTPSYMAPEQAQAQAHKNGVGPAADVYALGAILYELLTGRPPFRAESALETLRQLTTDEPVPPARLNAR